VVCKTVAHTVVSHRRKVKVRVQRCSTRRVSGTARFVMNSAHIRARVSRAHLIYATGTAVRTTNGRWWLKVKQRHIIHSGRYTLTLRGRHNGHRMSRRVSITITY
jgi:hypothetical protein